MSSIYARGNKLWARIKDEHGRWLSLPTKYMRGEEDKAKAYARRKEDNAATKRELRGGDDMPTVRAFAERWKKKREGRVSTWRDEASRLRDHALPHIGNLALDQVKTRHIRDIVDRLVTEARIAPRTIRHVYGTLRTMFQAAVREELIAANPCQLGRDELPRKVDKNPAWRPTAVYSRSEVEGIISDERIPLDRRVLYALLALTGCRFGEISALRWSAYDRTQEPLGRLSVHASYDVKTNLVKSVKTDNPRLVPVHPTLAKVLAEWRLTGWRSYTGRAPADDDLLMPSRRLDHRRVTHGRTKFLEDLQKLGLRKRRVHDLRRTFISLAMADGARKDILRWVTHGPEGDIVDLYTTLPWSTLCEEVAKLRISRREGVVVELGLATALLQVGEVRAADAVLAEVHGNRSCPDVTPCPSTPRDDMSDRDTAGQAATPPVANLATALAQAVLDGDVDRARELAEQLAGARLRLVG